MFYSTLDASLNGIATLLQIYFSKFYTDELHFDEMLYTYSRHVYFHYFTLVCLWEIAC